MGSNDHILQKALKSNKPTFSQLQPGANPRSPLTTKPMLFVGHRNSLSLGKHGLLYSKCIPWFSKNMRGLPEKYLEHMITWGGKRMGRQREEC